jgi:Transcriptional regulators
MDNIDKKILSILQEDATLPLSELSKKVGISTTPCWNRIKKLEKDKIILSKTIEVDNEKINLPETTFLMISVSDYAEEWLNNFESVVNKEDRIIEVHRISGSIGDYLLKILSTSKKDYDDFQQELIKKIQCTNMISNFSLKTIKKFKKIPLYQI